MNWYKIAKSIEEPWLMTQQEFLDYHNTGYIQSTAYDRYRTVEGINWIEKKNYPQLYSTKQFGNKIIEFRKSGEKTKYVKLDDDENIVRDERGLALYMSDEEMDAKGYNKEDESIAAFDGDVAIGWASNEFGADGVWVVDDYQRMGIGTYLLMEFRKQFKAKRKIGQMTSAGYNMTKKYHKELVKKAIEEGRKIPNDVLTDYPDLIKLYMERSNEKLV